MLISDHINLTATSPIEGANFVDLTDVYSPRLRAIAKEIDPRLEEGVYVQFRGPHYETPAEVRMAGILGGHLVGMSTTLEAIAARVTHVVNGVQRQNSMRLLSDSSRMAQEPDRRTGFDRRLR